MLNLISTAGALYFAGRTLIQSSKARANTSPLDDPHKPVDQAMAEGLVIGATQTCTVLGILALTPATGLFGCALLAHDAYTHRAKIKAKYHELRGTHLNRRLPQATCLRRVK
jgi:hypothetical protein